MIAADTASSLDAVTSSFPAAVATTAKDN